MKKTIICILTAGLLSSSAYAQSINTDINFETSDVTVSGILDKASANGWASIEITPEEGEGTAYIGVFNPEVSGNFSTTFRMADSAETGNYIVTIGLYGEKKIQNTIFYANAQDVQALLGTINDEGKSVEDIRKELDDKINVFNLSEEQYEKLDSEGKDNIAKALSGNKPYANLSEAKNVAYGAMAIESFRCAKNAKEIENVLKQFESVYEINENTVKCYDLIDEIGKEEDYLKNKQFAYELMSAFSAKNVDDVRSAFDDAVILAAISRAKDPATVREYLDSEVYKQVFDFDLAVYNKSNKDTVAKYIYAMNDIKSMNELENAIKAAYNQQQSGSSGAPGGGTPSKGNDKNKNTNGGGGVINLAPTVTNNDNNGETKNSFADLDKAEWAKEAIEYLYNKKIVSGVSENNFEPNAKLTREQYIVMLINAFNLTDENVACNFSDMKPEHWAYKAVSSAFDKNIVSGISDDLFGTGNEITRQDMAVMTYKAAKSAGYEFEESNEIDCADKGLISEYAKESVASMMASKFINGYPDGRFAPQENATRAEAAQIIYSMIR